VNEETRDEAEDADGETLAFVECICGVFQDPGDGFDSWDKFWGQWYVCRFENLSKDIRISAYSDRERGVVIYARSDRFEWSDSCEANDVDCRLSDLIADMLNVHETIEQLAEVVRRECEEGIRLRIARQDALLGKPKSSTADESRKADLLRESVSRLTDEERLHLFSFFCRHCGCVQPSAGRPCQCWNDE
jgi:hypothetical protein